jgi:glycosyltransferase involved in cell wall biosynthesis
METAQQNSSIEQTVKIAALVWYKIFPAKYGGQKVIAAFQAALAKRFPIVCICSFDNQSEGTEGYEVLPILPVTKWQIVNPFVWIKVAKLVKQHNITHLLVEHPYHVLTAWWCKWSRKTIIIHHAHNIEFERFELRNKWYWLFIKWAERKISRLAALNIYITNEDKVKAKAFFGVDEPKCFVLPYVVEKKTMPSKQTAKQQLAKQFHWKEEDKIYLFNGTLDYKPNAQAVEAIFDHLLPQLQTVGYPFRIVITGKIDKSKYQYLEKFMNEHVVYAGEVEQVEHYLAAADVFINPVTIGSGVQTKTLHAIASGLPVVCFNHMLNGIDSDAVKGRLFVAASNDWKDFASKMNQALQSDSTIPPVFWEHHDIETYMPQLSAKITSTK